MLKIRPEQKVVFKHALRQESVSKLATQLRKFFADELVGLSDTDLYRHIDLALDQAEAFGLISKRRVSQFMNLCVTYGWDFLERAENQWMQLRYLENTAISNPADRIDLLVDQCLWRMEVEEHNENVRANLGLVPLTGHSQEK